MYFYVFIMLLIGIIGFYAQLFMMQAAKMESSQTTVADELLLWHDEAYKVAKNDIATIGGGVPCVLVRNKSMYPSDCASTVSPPSAGGRSLTGMTFDSVIYKIDPVYYVVTYVQDTAGFAVAGYSQADVLKQLQNKEAERMNFGTTKAGTCTGVAGTYLFTTVKVGSDDVCYETDSSIVPNGVVGYVSTF